MEPVGKYKGSGIPWYYLSILFWAVLDILRGDDKDEEEGEVDQQQQAPPPTEQSTNRLRIVPAHTGEPQEPQGNLNIIFIKLNFTFIKQRVQQLTLFRKYMVM